MSGGELPGSLAELAALGARLRDAGLTARALAAWAGTDRIAALPPRLEALPVRSPTPAAAILALLVGGAELERQSLAGRGALIDELAARGLVEVAGGAVRATVAVVPIGRGLLVCDRLDAPVERDLVCWPDDSSHHLATAIPPGRRETWLDLGCGSAFAALARPELAARIAGIDLNARAVRYARLGAALSGIAHLTAEHGDAGAPHPAADLVTCNAPIPDGTALGAAIPELWRRADPGMFDRLWPALARAAVPGGTIVVHAAVDAMLPALADAAGERVVVTYTPPTVRGFAIAWWRPDAAPRLAITRRALTPERPHLEPVDRDDALARS